MKRWLEIGLVVLVVVLTAWLSTRELEATPPEEDPGVEMIWTVERGSFWYRKFELKIRGDETGAAWTAQLSPERTKALYNSRGTLTVQEWQQFLAGLRKAGGWSWGEFPLRDEPLPTDHPHYSLTLVGPKARTDSRVYGLPTDDHARVAEYIEGRLSGKILRDLEGQWEASNAQK